MKAVRKGGCFIYTYFSFPLMLSPPTKRLPPTRRFAVYFSQKAWLHFARDTKILTLNQSKNCFSYTLEFCLDSTFCKVLFTKSVVFVKKEIICFPLRYPFRQNGSPRLAVLQSTFHKKRRFCEKIYDLIVVFSSGFSRKLFKLRNVIKIVFYMSFQKKIYAYI